MKKKIRDNETKISTKEITKQNLEGDATEEKTINPVARREINTKKVTGNLLFKDDKNYYFAPKYVNCIMTNSRDSKTIDFHKYGIAHYILDQLSVFAKAENRPSLIIKSMDWGKNGDSLESILGQSYKRLEYASEMDIFNKEPSYYYCENNKYFEQITDEFYKSRSNSVFRMTPVFFIIDDMKNVDKSLLDARVITAASRHTHFIVVADSTEDCRPIVENFEYLQITCKNNKLVTVTEVYRGTPTVVKEY